MDLLRHPKQTKTNKKTILKQLQTLQSYKLPSRCVLLFLWSLGTPVIVLLDPCFAPATAGTNCVFDCLCSGLWNLVFGGWSILQTTPQKPFTPFPTYLLTPSSPDNLFCGTPKNNKTIKQQNNKKYKNNKI
jgi:hypothetical protein